jgi:hypothetical protein
MQPTHARKRRDRPAWERSRSLPAPMPIQRQVRVRRLAEPAQQFGDHHHPCDQPHERNAHGPGRKLGQAARIRAGLLQRPIRWHVFDIRLRCTNVPRPDVPGPPCSREGVYRQATKAFRPCAETGSTTSPKPGCSSAACATGYQLRTGLRLGPRPALGHRAD